MIFVLVKWLYDIGKNGRLYDFMLVVNYDM